MNFNVTERAVVEAPPEAVFELLTDIRRLPEWNREIRQIHEQPPVVGPGAQWAVEIHAMGTHWPSRSTVVDHDRGAGLFAYVSQSDDGNPSTAHWVWRIAPHARGAEVRVEASVTPKTFWRRHLFSKVRSRSLPKAVRASLTALQQQFSTSSMHLNERKSA
jgi:uncharacterized protein YndB with AHSA1/START domain